MTRRLPDLPENISPATIVWALRILVAYLSILRGKQPHETAIRSFLLLLRLPWPVVQTPIACPTLREVDIEEARMLADYLEKLCEADQEFAALFSEIRHRGKGFQEFLRISDEDDQTIH